MFTGLGNCALIGFKASKLVEELDRPIVPSNGNNTTICFVILAKDQKTQRVPLQSRLDNKAAIIDLGLHWHLITSVFSLILTGLSIRVLELEDFIL